MPPELELVLTIAQTAMVVHQTNKFQGSLQPTGINLEDEINEE